MLSLQNKIKKSIKPHNISDFELQFLIMVFKILSGLFQILGETLKVFLRNWKLISSITLLHIFLNSILFFPDLSSTKEPVNDFPTNQTNIPFNSTSLDKSSYATYSFYLITSVKMILQSFVGMKSVVLVANTSVFLIFEATIILASAKNFSGKGSRLRKFLSVMVKSWKRTLLTLFHAALLGLVYAFVVLAIVLSPTMNPKTLFLPWIAVLVITTAPIFLYYIYIVWNLAVVVSVLEEKCGVKALKRAMDLFKGFMLKGVLLNLTFELLRFVLTQNWRLDESNGSKFATIFVPFVIFRSISSITWVFSSISYTVLYYECKKVHVEFSKEMSYTIPLIVSVDHHGTEKGDDLAEK